MVPATPGARLAVYALGVPILLIAQLLVIGALVGVGLLLRRAYGLRALKLDDVFDAFWVGFCAVILALLLWNFAIPVNTTILLLVLGTGAVGLLLSRGALTASWSEVAGLPRPALASLLLGALWIANQSAGAMVYFDSALYHIQTVLWAKSHPAVPGVANLSAPLAYNNSGLLFGAMLDAGPLTGFGHRIGNAILMHALLARIILALARVARAGAAQKPREVFIAVLLPAALSMAYAGRLSSFATATATVILVLVAVERLALLLTQEQRDAEYGYLLFVFVALCATSVALKLSAAVFSVLAVPLALIVWRFRAVRGSAPMRPLAFAAGFALLIGVAWIARGVILSGYPAFPSTLLAADVDWRAPAEHAAAEYALVEHSSKVSTMLPAVISGAEPWGWLPRWTRVNLNEPFLVFIPLALALLWTVARVARRTVSPRRGSADLLVVPLVGAVAVWFFTAPEGRYAAGFTWGLAAWAAMRYYSGPQGAQWRGWRVALAALGTALVTMTLIPGIPARREAPTAVVKSVIKENVQLWAWPPWTAPLTLDPVQFDTFVTQSGLALSVPRDLCWDTPPPCTPNPAPNLELRVPPDVRQGFRVRGDWAMLNWPAKTRPAFLGAWRQQLQRRSR